jgi:hypothetical protein
MVREGNWLGLVRHNAPTVVENAWSRIDVVHAIARERDPAEKPHEKEWSIARSTASYIAGPAGANLVEGAKKVADKPSTFGTLAVVYPIGFLNYVFGENILDAIW